MKYYHATTEETAKQIMEDGQIRIGLDGVVYLCDKPEDAAKFVAIRGCRKIYVIEVDLDETQAAKVEESFDHSEAFFKCKAYVYPESISISNPQIFKFIL